MRNGSPPAELKSRGLLKPAPSASPAFSSALAAYASISLTFVAAMSERNSAVNGEIEAAVSFRFVPRRLPEVVFIA